MRSGRVGVAEGAGEGQNLRAEDGRRTVLLAEMCQGKLENFVVSPVLAS